MSWVIISSFYICVVIEALLDGTNKLFLLYAIQRRFMEILNCFLSNITL